LTRVFTLRGEGFGFGVDDGEEHIEARDFEDRLDVVLQAVEDEFAVATPGLALLSAWSIGFPIGFNTILGPFGLIGVAFNDSIVVLTAIREDPRAAG